MNLKMNRIQVCLFVFIFLLAAFLIFANLGDMTFFTDESETAIEARMVARTGKPLIWDGVNISPYAYLVANSSDFVSRVPPPVHVYIAGASFYLFGESEVAGRLPFALAGLATVVCVFLFSIHLTRNVNLALLAMFLCTVCLQFLLYCRQCRYYSLTMLGCLSAMYGYRIMNSKKGLALFVGSLLFLFYTHYVVFFTVFGGCAAHYFLFAFDKSTLKRNMILGVVVSLLTVPHIFLFLPRGPYTLMVNQSRNIFAGMIHRLFFINIIVFPFVILLGLLLYLLLKKKARYKDEYRFLLSLLFVGFFSYLSYLGSVDTRLCAPLFPLCAILTAMIFFDLKERSRWVAGIFLALYLATDLFQFAPVSGARFLLNAFSLDGKLKYVSSDIGSFSLQKELRKIFSSSKKYGYYLYEITHHYKTANEEIMKFLKANAEEGDYIYYPTTLSCPAVYYADGRYKFVGVFTPEQRKFIAEGLPEYVYSTEKVDWYIPRNRKRSPEQIKKVLEDFRQRGWTCTPIPLDCVDLAKADNIPWIRSHQFWTVTEGERLIVYKIEKANSNP